MADLHARSASAPALRAPSEDRAVRSGGLRPLAAPRGGRPLGRGRFARAYGPVGLGRSEEGRWGMTELIVALRWVALVLSLGVAGLGLLHREEVVGGATLSVVAVLRTIWPLRPGMPKTVGGRFTERAGALGELAVCTGVVAITGGVGSPFVLCLAAASFAFGVCFPAGVLGVPVVAAIGALALAGESGALAKPLAERYVEGAAVVGALSTLGSYSQWLVRKGREAKDEAVERLRSLGELNQLLLELHAKAAASPGALSLKTAVANLAGRLRQVLDPDVVVLMLSGPAGSRERWEVALAEGVGLPDVLSGGALAPALREAAGSYGPVCRSELGPGEGVAEEAWTGLYVPLWARDDLVGLLAIERVEPGVPFGRGDLEVVEGLSKHAGLAVDNARRFRRLRALGAEEERGRIARELHDRVGQSLAYLALSLERMAGEAAAPAGLGHRELSRELDDLASEARRVVREVRTKLSDLRAEVTEEHGLVGVVEGLLQRAAQRSGLEVSLTLGPMAALSPALGREVANIAAEAVNNAERHAAARRLEVRLAWDGRAGELVVADDGKGLPASAPLRPDAYGLLGMRERAETIGGSLLFESPPGRGTTVTLRWGDG